MARMWYNVQCRPRNRLEQKPGAACLARHPTQKGGLLWAGVGSLDALGWCGLFGCSGLVRALWVLWAVLGYTKAAANLFRGEKVSVALEEATVTEKNQGHEMVTKT